MAKQVGPVLFTGTIDGLIFYKLGDNYYTRSKGSYKSAKHMRRNPKYKRTMQKAAQFGGASKLTQEVYYRYLPKEVRKHGLFGKLTGMVNSWLQQGKNKEEVTELLIAHCQTLAQGASSITNIASTTPATTTIAQATTAPRQTTPVQSPTTPGIRKHKRARYLSCWKVKPNGRLYIPKRKAIVNLRFASVKKE